MKKLFIAAALVAGLAVVSGCCERNENAGYAPVQCYQPAPVYNAPCPPPMPAPAPVYAPAPVPAPVYAPAPVAVPAANCPTPITNPCTVPGAPYGYQYRYFTR